MKEMEPDGDRRDIDAGLLSTATALVFLPASAGAGGIGGDFRRGGSRDAHGGTPALWRIDAFAKKVIMALWCMGNGGDGCNGRDGRYERYDNNIIFFSYLAFRFFAVREPGGVRGSYVRGGRLR